MQETNEIRDRLIGEFIENYTEKLFYFCLKKTGNNIEAEDLMQDISLNILISLNKGIIPTSFSAWVWQIARNRYSVWAIEKHKRNESVSGSDIGDYEIEDESENVLDEMAYSEQMALLRSELAFIRCDYRDIVVAYYIENRSVRDIASSLSLSVSAVQQRLHRARNLLKEGMDMAREFGKRSYDPENIMFTSSGPQPSGLPWTAVNRKIPKNILLHASNNPSTLEELSIELGIALPYMEEEVEILHSATLLEKQGDKYITNFFILDKDCRIEVYHALRKVARERSRLIREFIDDSLINIRAMGIDLFVGAIFGIIRLAMGLDGCRERNSRPVVISPAFRKESAVLKEHQSIIRFVSKYHIKTPQDIRDAVNECQARMENLKAEREILYNRIRRPKPTDTVEKLKAARDSLTRDIAEAREQLKTANKLTDLLTRMEKEIDEEMALERSNIPLPEPTTADDVSRYINSEDYDPAQHRVPSETQPRGRKRGDWER